LELNSINNKKGTTIMNTTTNNQAKPAKKLTLTKESIRLLNTAQAMIETFAAISITGCSLIVC
jgi:hypothetical protein